MSLLAIGLMLMLPAAAPGDVVPPAPEPSNPAPRAQDSALDAPMVAALQLGAACGSYAVGVPLLTVGSYGCPLLSCGLCLTPAAAGYLGTWIGDRYGGQRAPAIWPIAAAYGGLLLSGVGLGVLYWGALSGDTVVALFGGAGVLAGVAASAIGVPAAYALSAEDKLPGDDGTALPGILEAGHPAAQRRTAQKVKGASPPPARPPEPTLPDLPPPPLLEPQGALHAMGF